MDGPTCRCQDHERGLMLVRAGLYQFDCRFGQIEENTIAVENALRGEAFDLLVLPELFTTGYFFAGPEEALQLSEPIPDGPTTQFLARLAKGHQAYIVAGLAETGRDRAYNSAVVVGPNGYMGHHRKIHLTGLETGIFAPGNRGSVFSLGGIRVGLAICYDLWFPELTRQYLRMDVQLICHPANFGGSMTLDVARARAVENVSAVITANRIGVEEGPEGKESFRGESRIIAPSGDILNQAGGEEALLWADLSFSRPGSPRQLGADLGEQMRRYSSGQIRIREFRE